MDGWVDRWMSTTPQKRNTLQTFFKCCPTVIGFMAESWPDAVKKAPDNGSTTCVCECALNCGLQRCPVQLRDGLTDRLEMLKKCLLLLLYFENRGGSAINGKHYSLIYVFGQILTQHFLTLKVSNTFSVRKPHQ